MGGILSETARVLSLARNIVNVKLGVIEDLVSLKELDDYVTFFSSNQYISQEYAALLRTMINNQDIEEVTIIWKNLEQRLSTH